MNRVVCAQRMLFREVARGIGDACRELDTLQVAPETSDAFARFL